MDVFNLLKVGLGSHYQRITQSAWRQGVSSQG